jgi:hypothetical protein
MPNKAKRVHHRDRHDYDDDTHKAAAATSQEADPLSWLELAIVTVFLVVGTAGSP